MQRQYGPRRALLNDCGASYNIERKLLFRTRVPVFTSGLGLFLLCAPRSDSLCTGEHLGGVKLPVLRWNLMGKRFEFTLYFVLIAFVQVGKTAIKCVKSNGLRVRGIIARLLILTSFRFNMKVQTKSKISFVKLELVALSCWNRYKFVCLRFW